ncbi:hypothetical protein [Stenotrophomonas maltophilia]|uniref:hypothetical protein n=1 Tax=Stenotrophomonas maltophilia TaxID=40324 RepID=UPI0021C92B3E|nr:hypothetical protein [Stenotrophomonas maltophilia]MCU1145222.1 hypothetical protein [Stenotrophomonas maltophilia]
MPKIVTINVEVPADFLDFCALENVDPGKVLGQFACDLAEAEQCAGQAQHDAAEIWFDAGLWPGR